MFYNISKVKLFQLITLRLSAIDAAIVLLAFIFLEVEPSIVLHQLYMDLLDFWNSTLSRLNHLVSHMQTHRIISTTRSLYLLCSPRQIPIWRCRLHEILLCPWCFVSLQGADSTPLGSSTRVTFSLVSPYWLEEFTPCALPQ